MRKRQRTRNRSSEDKRIPHEVQRPIGFNRSDSKYAKTPKVPAVAPA